MKKLIRHSVFETNSSSSHSITLTGQVGSDVLYDTIPVDEEGICHVRGGEIQFGWDFEDYNTPQTKANYLYIYATQYADTIKIPIFLDLIERVFKEHLQCEAVVFQDVLNSSRFDYAYIDHQSSECGHWDHLFYNEKLEPDTTKIKDFIFNPKSMLHTGNDN